MWPSWLVPIHYVQWNTSWKTPLKKKHHIVQDISWSSRNVHSTDISSARGLIYKRIVKEGEKFECPPLPPPHPKWSSSSTADVLYAWIGLLILAFVLWSLPSNLLSEFDLAFLSDPCPDRCSRPVHLSPVLEAWWWITYDRLWCVWFVDTLVSKVTGSCDG